MLAARRLTGDADIWLKGEHGPPFFELTLATGAYFACLGAGLGSGRGRLQAALASGGASFAALAVPMMAGTRLFRWGEDGAETRAWIYLVLGSYAAACAAGVYAAGAATEAGGWRAGLKALAAAFAAWVFDRWVVASLPFKGLMPLAGGLLPAPAMAVTGALWGLAVGVAVGGKSAGGGR